MKRKFLILEIILPVSVFSIIFVFAWSGAFLYYSFAGSLREMDEKARLQEDELATTLSPLVWNFDHEVIDEYVKIKMRDREFISIRVTGDNGQVIATAANEADGSAIVAKKRAIVYRGTGIGSVEFTLSGATLRGESSRTAVLLLTTIAAYLAMAITVMVLSTRTISGRLGGMLGAIREMSETGKAVLLDAAIQDELGVFANAINKLSVDTENRTKYMGGFGLLCGSSARIS